MNNSIKSTEELLQELEETRRQLLEAEEIIEAIRTGQVDALVVQNGSKHQLYTLHTADHAYRVFIEKMNEGAVTLNRQGNILYANSQFAAMVCKPLSLIIGLPFMEFIAPASRPYYLGLFEISWSNDCKGEILLLCLDFTIPVQLSLNLLELADGVAMSIILTDLSFQKAAQQQLEDNNRQLEHLNKTLEASNHDLQQFASVASHDLQEPLRKIQLFSDLIKTSGKSNLSARELNYLDKIIASADRMKTLIVDVLNYSRLAGSEGGFSMVDLNRLVKDLLEDFELVIQEKQARIELSALAILEVNRGQIRQMIQNLVSNALKFSRPGVPPVVTITGRRLALKKFDSAPQADGPFYMICVTDNGIGFEEKYIPTIFALFERLNAKEKYDGTGIGLAITKKIIEKHDGLIHVKSKVGQGSEFQIILPVKHLR